MSAATAPGTWAKLLVNLLWFGQAIATVEALERIHQRALTRYGPADEELLAVALPEEEEEQAGIRLRHGSP